MVRNQGVAYREGSASSLTNERRVLVLLANGRRVLPVQVAVEAGPGLGQQPRHGVEADLEVSHVRVGQTPENVCIIKSVIICKGLYEP